MIRTYNFTSLDTFGVVETHILAEQHLFLPKFLNFSCSKDIQKIKVIERFDKEERGEYRAIYTKHSSHIYVVFM